MSRRKKLWIAAGGILAVLVAAIVVFVNQKAADLEPAAKKKVIQYLEQRFDSSVELAELKITAAPGVRVMGRSLVLRHKRRTDIPPLIRIERFTFETSWPELAAPVSHISHVRLEGLKIHTPPRKAPGSPDREPEPRPAPDSSGSTAFVVDQIVADRAMLRLLPRDPAKPIQEFELHELRLAGAGPDRSMTYHTRLKNYKPPGIIESRGQFGPWNADEPGRTPLAATYQFNNADLGVFKGIAGTLRSTGKFSGELNHIVIDGETGTPDFRLKMAGNTVPLKTKFHAIVDGTDGDTYLESVEATLGRSKMTVRGAVAGEKNVKGKVISLDTVMKGARLEDILRLTVKGRPPLSGSADVNVKLLVPRGDEDVIEKLGLDGTFAITSVKFADPAIQGKIDELSRRGQGRPGDSAVADMRSEMKGTLVVGDTVAKFSKLTYTVEGAEVDVTGRYGVKSEEIDFDGVLRMDARMSRTFKGMKSLMLRPFDRLFSRGETGTVLSIQITGTREQPKFGLDVKRTLGKKDQ